MSRSYKTDKMSVIAEIGVSKDKNRETLIPRLIERKPKKGDVNPISKRIIRGLLKILPPEYYYGLKRIEVIPRQSEEVGNPFGKYSETEKTIYLYSLPMIWEFPSKLYDKYVGCEKIGASIENDGDKVRINWNHEFLLGFWFVMEVFFHELGHHRVHQYRAKKKKPVGITYNEIVANLRADKIREIIFKDFNKSSA